jgi:hypothetical protein
MPPSAWNMVMVGHDSGYPERSGSTVSSRARTIIVDFSFSGRILPGPYFILVHQFL